MVSQLTDQEFLRFQHFIFTEAGIALGAAKKALVAGRLAKRLEALSIDSFGEYLKFIGSPQHGAEAQTAIDLLTTNETYFFREQKHFDLLKVRATEAARARHEFRVWSAACSSGEEPYSIAMVLADCFGVQSPLWSVMGSDISERVLLKARNGHYPLSRTTHVPEAYLQKFCLKGVGTQQGTLLVDRKIRSRVELRQLNLNRPLPTMKPFDMIFLRNVMIYFNQETKQQVVARLLPLLKPEGEFLVGHSESLHGICNEMTAIAPAIYARAGAR